MNPRLVSHPILRLSIAVTGILACLIGIWLTQRAGMAALMGKYAMVTGDLNGGDEAIKLAPSDAQTHVSRAAVLYYLKRVPEAVKELEIAVSLRPRDHTLWVQLAIFRDELRDSAGALPAFNEAVRLAPFYAQPSWQRGNFLLRAGRYEEAFADMRRAAASNPEYIPNLIDLAWSISQRNTKTTEQLAQINTPQMRLAFADVLAWHGNAREATEQFALAGPVSDEARRDLVRRLISVNAFAEAFEVWNNNADREFEKPIRASIYDGGFEGSLSLDDGGFGWRLPHETPGVKLASDSSQFQSGKRSLLIEFVGDSNPGVSLVSQLLRVEPSRHYRINFSVRSQDLVTGGLPFVAVSDAVGGKQLAQSTPLHPGLTEWKTVSFEFQAEPSTKVVVLSVQRRNCPESPCPIFGFLWLDSFSIEEVVSRIRDA